MATNNKISTVVSNQLPDFIRSDHPNFVLFLQAYYEYLEQSNSSLSYGKTIERTKNLRNYFDTDKITDSGLQEFNTKLYNQFLSLVPKEISADKSKLLKNVRDFYLSRGTEKSYNFLFQLLFNEQPEFYYPKNDVLIASSGKWLIEKSIRLNDIFVNSVSDESISSLLKFKNTKIVGNTSGAQAQVERVLVSYERGVRYNEFFLSKQIGEFDSGETVFAINIDNETLSGNLLAGYVSSITLTSAGSGYVAGTSIPIIGDGSGAAAIISSVSAGNVSNITVVTGGSGYKVNDFMIFSGGGGGSGANANVSAVASNGRYHPSSYNLNSDIIDTYSSTLIGAYSNSSGGNANTAMSNTLTFYTISGLGPITGVRMIEGGSNYSSVPSISANGNTAIKNLGIIGTLRINDGGSGYTDGAQLTFTNIIGGYGYGANGNVRVNAAGSIISANVQPFTGHITGGSGYSMSYLPKVTVSGAGSGADIVVDSLLGFGGEFTSETGILGAIESITLTSSGIGYTVDPTVSFAGLTGSGAAAIANVVAGTYTYPGRFKDDTGLLSSSNYLQDRDYYQNFSYVIKLRQSIENYRKYVNDLVHPTGMKLWAEYIYESDPAVNDSISIAQSNTNTFKYYTANALYFNGTDSIIYKNTSANTTNSKNGTISFWFNASDLSNDQIIFGIANTANLTGNIGLLVYLTSKGTSSNSTNSTIRIVGRNRANTTILDMQTNVTNKIIANNWYHILAGWDLNATSNANCVIYINNVNSTNLISRSTSETNVNYLGANVYIGTTPLNNNAFKGCLSEIWFANVFANVVNSTIRTYFMGSNGAFMPSYLGPSGNVNTNIYPVVYLRSNSSNSNTNSGTGGNFTFANNIIKCNTSPSDV